MKLKNTFFAVMLIIAVTSSVYSQTTDDAGISGIDPLSQYAGNLNLHAYLKNFGTDTLTTVTINYILDSSPGTAYSWSGNLLQDSIYGPIDLGTFYAGGGSHVLKVYSSNPNDTVDGNNANDTLTVSFTLTVPASLPYCQSFENTLGMWQQSTTDNFNWTILSGATPTTSTGPDAAYDGSYYIYTEANNITTGWTANLELPVDFTNVDNPEISFYYHMYGTNMGSLHLDVYDNTWHNDVWSLSGNQGNTWTNHITNLSAYANFGVVIIRFRGIRGNGNASDLALDKVCVYEVFATDLAVTSILQPAVTWCSDSTTNVIMIVKNNGSTAQTDIPVGVNIIKPDTTTLSLSDTLTGTLAAGATDTITIGTFNMYEYGLYNVKGYTAVSGDEDLTNDTLSVNTEVKADISTFPFTENFESGNIYFSLKGTTYASASITTDAGNHVLYFTGGNLNTAWTGQQYTTTATNAWVDNVLHHAWGYTCSVDATSLTDVRLKFDLKQVSPANYNLYNWVRVLVNDTVQLTDVNGVTNFNPPLTTYQTKTFNLSAYAGTQFKLTFQGAMKYNSTFNPTVYPGGDNAYIDNIMIYQPVENDAGIVQILTPSGYDCPDSTVDVTVVVKNFGSNNLDTIPVIVHITSPVGDVTTLTDTVFSTLTSEATTNFTLSSFDGSEPGAYQITATTSLSGDIHNLNDTADGNYTSLSGISTFPFYEDFESGNNYFKLQGTTAASASIASDAGNNVMYFTGGTVTTGWTGTGTTTTAANAWTQNTTHHAFGYTCVVDATALTNVRLKFNLKQVSPAGNYLHNWVRVLINDTVQITDISGVTNYNPPQATYATKIFDLASYAGTVFKITIQGALRYNSSYSPGSYPGGDNAYVDNINIYQPGANDAGISGIDPLSQYSGNLNLNVYIKNFGTDTLTSATINYKLDNNPGTPYSWTGSLLQNSTDGPVTLGTIYAASGNHVLKVFSANPNGSSDGDNSNDTLTLSFTLVAPVILPYCESFENTLGQWQQATGDNFDWTVLSGSTATANTGPDAAYDGSYYIYTEASSPVQTGWIASIELPVDLTTIDYPLLTFYFHMYGVAMGSLHIDVYDTIWHTDVWTLSGDQGNIWTYQAVDLTTYANFGIVRIRFRSIRGTASTSDMALDKVCIYELFETDLNVLSLNDFPGSGCSLDANQSISINILNNGSSTIFAGTQIPAGYSVNGGAAVTENISIANDVVSNQSFPYTFTQVADLSNDGTYNIKVWVAMPGDGDLTNDTIQGSATNVIGFGIYPYVQDFETNSDGWNGEMIAGSNSWQLGTPAQTNINSAHSGTNAWMTNLTQNYPMNEHSALYSPCFDFSGLMNPSLSFWLRLHSEANYDGAVLEATIDDGVSWTKIGAAQAGFYNSNTNQNPAPQLITVPWWSGNNNAWTHYLVSLSNYAGQEGIRFRFRFASDYAVADEGLAIDDFSITDIMSVDAGADQQICPGVSAQLNVTVSGGNSPFTYLWHPTQSLNDSTIANPVATPDSSTTYYVTVTDSYGVVIADSVFIEITENPVIDLGNDFDICQGESVPLGAPAGVSYLWSNGETTQTIMITQAGTYSVTVDEGNGCIGISNEVAVGVNPLPVVDLGSDIQATIGETVTLDAANPGAAFHWSTGATTQTIDVTVTGTYSVTVTSTDGCSASDQIVVTFVIEIPELTSGLFVNVYPNPNNGKFRLDISNAAGNLTVDMFNVTGMIVYRRVINSQNSMEIDISGMDKGFYYLRLSDGRTVINRKILSQ
jgi:hypothetical protein